LPQSSVLAVRLALALLLSVWHVDSRPRANKKKNPCLSDEQLVDGVCEHIPTIEMNVDEDGNTITEVDDRLLDSGMRVSGAELSGIAKQIAEQRKAEKAAREAADREEAAAATAAKAKRVRNEAKAKAEADTQSDPDTSAQSADFLFSRV
jgi:hypothetical protein